MEQTSQPVSRKTPRKANVTSQTATSPSEAVGGRRARAAATRRPPKSVEQQKQEAILSNPPGVMIYNPNLEDNKAVMAGYLGLEHTDQLFDLIENGANAALLQQFRACRNVGFGITGRTGSSGITTKQVFDTVSGLEASDLELLTSTLPIRNTALTSIDVGPASVVPAYYTYAATMYQLMELNPTVFKEANNSVLGHSIEDWHRAYSMIRFHHRQCTIAKERQLKRGNRSVATVPSFLTPADFRATATEAKVDGQDEDTEMLDADRTDDEVEDDSDLSEYELDEAGENNIADSLEKGPDNLSGGGDLNKATVDCQRPPLTRGQVRRFLEAQGEKPKVLHNVGQRLNPSFEPIVKGIEAEAAISVRDREEKESSRHAKEQAVFWKTMSKLSTVSVPTVSYEESCAALGLDVTDPKIGTSQEVFKPWQVIAVWKMIQMERDIYQGGINASDCGLGKTVTALAVVEQAARFAADDITTVHKPTLIIMPAGLLDVWYDDWRKFFCGQGRLILKQFYGSPIHVNSPRRRATILGSQLSHLEDYLAGLDPKDPATSRVVIITAYSTWWKRTLHGRDKKPVKASGQGKREDNDNYFDEENSDDDDIGPDENTGDAPPQAEFYSAVEHKFARVVCDEAHAVKNRRTFTHQSVLLLKAPKKWFVSATPMINHVKDLAGYLTMLWNNEWALSGEYELDNFYKADFDPMEHLANLDDSAATDQQQSLLTAVDAGSKPYLLNPVNFLRVARAETPEPAVIGLALRAILGEIQLRHTMATEIEMPEGSLRIGHDIPMYRVYTVELKMNREQAQRYRTIWQRHAGKLYTGGKAVEEGGAHGIEPEADGSTGRLNMVTHRRVVHATFNNHLETLVDHIGKNSLVKDINKWYEKTTKDFGKDYGVTHFFRHARAADYYPPYSNRLDMATFMAAGSVKLQYLCRLLAGILFDDKERVQVVVDLPMEQWTVEAFLVNLGLNVLSLRSAHSHSDRRATIKRFNDPNAPVDVLVTNFRTSSLGVNLQGACCKTIILDIAANVNTVIQTIGRIHRLGQTKEQDIWIVTVDETYDQVLQAKATNKMLSQLLGEARVPGKSEEEKIGAAEKLIVKMLGQRCSRRDWGDLDLKAKNKLVQEPFMTGDQKLAQRSARLQKKLEETQKKKQKETGGKLNNADLPSEDSVPPSGSASAPAQSKPSSATSVEPELGQGFGSTPDFQEFMEDADPSNTQVLVSKAADGALPNTQRDTSNPQLADEDSPMDKGEAFSTSTATSRSNKRFRDSDDDGEGVRGLGKKGREVGSEYAEP